MSVSHLSARSTIMPTAFRWEMIGLLWLAFFLNQADRQVFNVVLPLIRADLHLSDVAMGAIGTVFMVVYAATVPVAGLLGDRLDRRGIVAFSLLVFSAGTLLTGFASTFPLLLLFRGLATGVGEACYSPAAASLISSVHLETRARALSLHQTANYTGIVLGSLLAGLVAERFGWRWSFLMYGIAGLSWGLLVLIRMRRYRFPAASPGAANYGQLLREGLLAVFTTPIILAQTIAFGGMIFALVGFLAWAPTLLYEQFHLTVGSAGFAAAFYHHLLAYAGVLGASVLTDRMVRRFPRVRLIVMAGGMILSAPCLWWAAGATSLLQMYCAFAAFGFARGLYDAGIYAALFDVVQDRLRSTVSSIVIAIAFLIGAASPLIMGIIKADHGIQGGMVLLGVVVGIAGLFLLTVAIVAPARHVHA